ADVVTVQLGTLGIKLREGVIFDEIARALGPRAIVDRTPAHIAKLEGFDAGSGVVRGDAAIDTLRFRERGLRYAVPLAVSQKTGFYVDQRPLRARVEQLSHGRRVLDTFTFIGSFAMAAARGGAERAVACDESAIAVEIAAACARENGLDERITFIREDARHVLARASKGGGYDLVICDPPKPAPS